MRILIALIISSLFYFSLQAQVTASFTIPDTVCLNAPVDITNTSVGATSYFWNFCVANLDKNPTVTDLGNPGSQLNSPVFMDYVFVNNNYYGFVTNYVGGNLTRLNFGNSLLNTPTATNLGNFGGVIPSFIGAEGIQVVQQGGNWFAIIVAGYTGIGVSPRIIKIEFGSDITNASPTATDWGNVGNMDQPIDLHLFEDNNHWYGFTVNAENNSITRFDFTTSFSNTPTATNLGNIGNLSYPTGIFAINDNGYWHAFVVNAGDNTRQNGPYSITRLDFGNSLQNPPAGTNLGNPGNLLAHPRDMTIMQSCDQVIGFVVNGHPSNANIIKLNFNNDLFSVPVATTAGNIGNASFPHCISKLFRAKENIYGFITNVSNNTLMRLEFPGCNNSSNSFSTVANPPAPTYNAPGVYNINLTVDDGLATQSAFCKQVVVLPSYPSDFNYKQDVCDPYTIQFFNTNNTIPSPSWLFGDGSTNTSSLTPVHNYGMPGNYTVKFAVQDNKCTDTLIKTISLNVVKGDIVITPDTVICENSTQQLLTKPSLEFCWTPTTYLDDANSPNPVTSTPQDITYYFTAQTAGNNLITNGDFSAGNSGFTSTYTSSNINSSEGQYLVNSNAPAWNPNMSNCSDHTSGNGNMMMINGSPNADAVIWSQTITVTPNTNYAFSTWIQSLSAGNPAMLQFSINNTNIGSLITASVPTCTWDQFFTTWNSGSGNTATISIVNKNIIRDGNDFALDDISFAPVLVQRDSVIVLVEKPVVTTRADTTICSMRPVPLSASGAATWSWSPANGLSDPLIAAPVARPASTTEYTVTGTTIYGCTATDKVTINTVPLPTIVMTPDTAICIRSSIQLNAFSAGSTAYNWQTDPTLNDLTIPNPIASPSVPTRYVLEVTGANNCTNTDSVDVSFIPYPNFKASGDKNVCYGNSLTLNASGGDTYNWTPATAIDDQSAAQPVVTPLSNTLYSVYIKDETCGFDTTISMSIFVRPIPTVIAQKSGDIDCIVHTSKLFATGGLSYSWTPAISLDNPTKPNPVASVDTTTSFIVKGTNQWGCYTYDTVKVEVTNTGMPAFLVPNAFTPNGDGNNDCFGIKQWGSTVIREFAVYTRWGQKLYTTTDPRACWDGKFKGITQDAGQYIYVIKAKTICGEMTKKGFVLLIR